MRRALRLCALIALCGLLFACAERPDDRPSIRVGGTWTIGVGVAK